MRKITSVLVLCCVLLALLSGCFLLELFEEPADGFEGLLQELGNLSSYAFTAVGTISFEGDAPPIYMPSGFAMEGTHAVHTEQFSAALQYLDIAGRPMYHANLLEMDSGAYISFVPMFQQMMDMAYIEHGAGSVAELFKGSAPYLIYTDAVFSTLLPDVPALVASLDQEMVQEALITDQDIFSLTVPNAPLSIQQLAAFAGPLELLAELQMIASYGLDTDRLFSLPLRVPTSQTLELTLTRDKELGTFTSWLTLIFPGEMTITVDVTYQALQVDPIATPDHVVDVAQLQEFMQEFHTAQARRIFVDDNIEEVMRDLPELHLVNHRLDDEAELLEHYDIEVAEQVFQVSVMSGTTATSTEDTIFSWAPSLSIFYKTLPAYDNASERMAPFILDDLDPEQDHDASNFHQTPMRTNAQDTTAVTGLFFDDNLVGRTIHIYILQNLEGTDMALFLRMVVILENMTDHGHDVLEQLGLLIGLDLQGYVDMAATADAETELEESE